MLTLSADRTPQVGVPEAGDGVTLSGFVERVGDPVPLVAPDGASYVADTLVVEALDAMVELSGGPAGQLAIAVPAHWSPPTLRALRNALRTNPSLSHAGMPPRLVGDAVASLTALRANPGLPSQGVVALLDFGGGGTSITLADAASGYEPIDETTRHADFSGDQIDQALLTHVLDGIAQSGGIDPAATAAVGSLARLREECRLAKERLSADTATDLAVDLPGYAASVRVTRTELETLMQAPLAGALQALQSVLDRNRVGWQAISAVVTIGGGANIPLVTQQLSGYSRAEVVTTPQPALDAAIGAALSAAELAEPDAHTGMAPTMGAAAVLPTDGIPTDVAASAVEDSAAFRALAWSEDDAGDDVVPYAGPDLVESYGSETAARPAVQYVPPTGPIEQQRSGRQRLPLSVFAVAAALVLVAAGGVTYALTSATGSAPSTEVRPPEPKPMPPQEVAPPPPVEPPVPVAPPPEPVTQAPPPPVTVTQAPPPPVTETHVVTQTPTTTTTTTEPPTTTTTTEPPPTTTTTTPPTTTTTVPTTTTTTTNPMTTTYLTVPFVPVPIPIQVPNRGEPPNPYPQQPPNPFQPYP